MDFWLDPNKTTEEIAQELLGCLIIKDTKEGSSSGWIVETEAYLGEIDEAAHSYGLRKTPRLASMYKEPGTVYIYSMHTHQMLNLAVQKTGVPHAILIRAIEPYTGIELMKQRRNKEGYLLSNGPGKLTKAMGIDQTDDGTQITNEPLYLSKTKRRTPKKIDTSARIGIPNKGIWTDALLRYTVSGNPYISGKKGQLDNDFGWETTGEDVKKRKEELK